MNIILDSKSPTLRPARQKLNRRIDSNPRRLSDPATSLRKIDDRPSPLYRGGSGFGPAILVNSTTSGLRGNSLMPGGGVYKRLPGGVNGLRVQNRSAVESLKNCDLSNLEPEHLNHGTTRSAIPGRKFELKFAQHHPKPYREVTPGFFELTAKSGLDPQNPPVFAHDPLRPRSSDPTDG